MGSRLRRAALIAACILGIAALTGCGSSSSSGGGDSQEAALASLRLNSEAARLQGEMGKLVGSLGADPAPARQTTVRRRLVVLDREAAELIATAAGESTYEVALRPLNGGRSVGTATLVESGGKVAMRGTLRGLGDGEHPVAIYALGPGEGRSVCPPADAAAGADGVLSAREAAAFYGRPAVRLGSVGGGAAETVSFSGAARRSPPLDVRVLVVGGGPVEGGYRSDLPVACGVPLVAKATAARSSAGELVTAVTQTRAAGVEIAAVVGDPTAPRATAARTRAETHLDAAAGHLAVANHIAIHELRAGGDVSSEDRRAAAGAMAAAGSSQAAVQGGLAKLKARVARERHEEGRRLAQRHAAQQAARREAAEANAPAAESSPEPEISAEPEPTPEPEFVPEPEPAPEPAPAPAPEGPTIASP
ncbi:MAG: hypothetical protein ACRDPE_21585 [Solirubrobacterales bacterium]